MAKRDYYEVKKKVAKTANDEELKRLIAVWR